MWVSYCLFQIRHEDLTGFAMVSVTADDSEDNHCQPRQRSRESYAKKFIIFIIFLLLNDITIILAKTSNRPESKNYLSPNTDVDQPTKDSTSYSNLEYAFDPLLQKYIIKHVNNSDELSFLSTPARHKSTEHVEQRPKSKRSGKDSHDNTLPEFGYDGTALGRPGAMRSSVEDAFNPSEDTSFKNFTLFDNVSLSNFSGNGSLDANITMYDDDSSAIVMGIMSVVLGILILVTVVGKSSNYWISHI